MPTPDFFGFLNPVPAAGARARDDRLIYCLDLANNHQGDVDHGCRIIRGLAHVRDRTAAQILLKLQFRELSTILHPADRCSFHPQGAPLSRHAARFRQTALTPEQFGELVDCARELKMPIYATPFDEPSVEACVQSGFDLLKVASCSAFDWPLLRAAAETGLPTVVSVGGLKLNEIDDLVDFFAAADCPLALMHCVSSYPTQIADLQLDQIRQLQERYPHIPVGYSGHETPSDMDVVQMAVAKGAEILERHVGLPTADITLNKYSLSVDESEIWIRSARRAASACAAGALRRPAQGEAEALSSLRRGIYARHTIPAGHTITAADVFLAIPCLPGQFHAGKLFEVLDSFTPMEPIDANMPIGLDVECDIPRPLLLSSIAARVDELLAEARIHVDDDVTVELSHQYGLERFFEIGAVLIDVVNRDYCKKLVVLLPGQSHPSHRHQEKEETFHVLSGDVSFVLDGTEHHLTCGQTLLVERGVLHSFSTETGAIFEEVSTTHTVGDSHYEDPAITSDPARRKTRIVLPSMSSAGKAAPHGDPVAADGGPTSASHRAA